MKIYPLMLWRSTGAKDITTKDVAFCLMIWLGLSQVDSCIIAYHPKASRNSVAAMASRKAKEDWAIEYLNRLSDLWYEDKLKFK